MRDMWDFIIIGGGASGMAAAIAAAKSGDKVLLLEKSPALGRKISASGNGRCNLMNIGKPVYYGDSAFAQEVLKHYPKEKLLRFWKDLGLLLSTEDDGRIYPGTYHSSSVIDAMKTALNQHHVDIRLQTAVNTAEKKTNVFEACTSREIYRSARMLIATGGPAYPKLGGTSSGFRLLSCFGHHIIPAVPSLCPICTDARSISGLSGIRVRCGLTLVNPSRQPVIHETGELLFTEYGISGICAMQCARFIDREGFTVRVDFLEPYSIPQSDAVTLLISRRSRSSGLSPEHILNGILVPRLSYAVFKQSGVPTRNRTAKDITDKEIAEVAARLTSYTLQVTGVRGFDYAQVTAGGVSCSEFHSSTLESDYVPGLHAAGELLNVDGDCGGYNLMFAFASGILAGLNGREETFR